MGMLNPVHVLQAVWNAARMDKDERTRLLLASLVSRDIYNAGNRLQHLAQRVGGEFEEEVDDYLTRAEILVVERVWELTEANGICNDLEQRINEAQKRLEEQANV